MARDRNGRRPGRAPGAKQRPRPAAPEAPVATAAGPAPDPSSAERLLNVGCGPADTWIEGSEGIDLVDFGQEYVGDILTAQLPGPYDVVFLHGVVQQVADTGALFDAVGDLLRVGGIVDVRVPVIPFVQAFADPANVKFIPDELFFRYLTDDSPAGRRYSRHRFDVVGSTHDRGDWELHVVLEKLAPATTGDAVGAAGRGTTLGPATHRRPTVPARRTYPVFIPCRDRVTDLERLIAWLESVGQERIFLLDNDSTYEPLLAFYERTPHTVVRLGANVGHRSPWLTQAVDRYSRPGEHFIVTDPDVIPREDCPPDAIEVFRDALDREQRLVKAGFSLELDDLPETFAFRDQVVTWERQFWGRPLGARLYSAPIDTTFALYRPGTGYLLAPAARTARPYVARHMGWYTDSANPTDEERWYRDHARRDSTYWSKAELDPKVAARIGELAASST